MKFWNNPRLFSRLYGKYRGDKANMDIYSTVNVTLCKLNFVSENYKKIVYYFFPKKWQKIKNAY